MYLGAELKYKSACNISQKYLSSGLFTTNI